MNKMKKLGEEGFAPIIVSIIIVIVLSLITLGFVSLANNSAKNALNRQLSNNAYYAADSGINDAIKAIASGSYTGTKQTCGPVVGNPYLGNNQINGPQDYYSCLLINPSPATLQYSSVSSNQPIVALLSTVNSSGAATNPSYFIFSWEPSAQVEASPYVFAPASYFPNCTIVSNIYGACLPAAANWIDSSKKPITGILRLSLTPLQDRNTLPSDTSSTYTAFLYPQSGSGSVNSAPSYSSNTIGPNSGLEVSGNCNSVSTQPDNCTVEIPVSSSATNGYIMSMRSLYTNSRVTIEAFDSQGNPLLFNNGQTMIDSTGFDHGVKRRIQVRISSLNYNGFPGYDIASSNSICKDLQAYPANNATGNPGNAISICGL